MRLNFTLVLGFILSSFFACDSKLEAVDYIQWVNNYKNGLHTVTEANDLVFDLQFKPDQYRFIEQKGMATSYEVVDSVLQHYTLKISTKNGEDLMRINSVSNADVQLNDYYFSYLFQDVIFLEEGGVVKPCELFHFEKYSDGSKRKVFNLAFENTGYEGADVFVIIKSERINTNPVRLKISKSHLPDLKI